MVNLDFAWIFLLPILAVCLTLILWFVMDQIVALFLRIFQ